MREFYRNLHALHPDERLIRITARVEDREHIKECETPFSQESYEFRDADGTLWRQWICWCGSGTYVEKGKAS